MPTPADRPLRKVTLNLYEEDCAFAEHYFGHGWTTTVRDIFSKFIYTEKLPQPPRTLGDLDA